MIQPLTNQMYPCMPMTNSSYQSQTVPQNNAVKIDIHNPYAGNQPAYNPYSMPQSSIYNPCENMSYPQYMTCPQPMMIPPMVMQTPQQPVIQPVIMEQPKAPEPVQPIIVPPSVVVPQPVTNNMPQINNAPQIVPVPPVAETVPPVEVTPAQATAETVNATPVETVPAIEAKADAAATEAKPAETKQPQVETPAAAPINVDLNQLVSKLNSTSADTQLGAIETIAETAQSGTPASTQLLDTQIIDALSSIIKRDTTQMQAPTPEQIKLRQKLLSGEKLTDDQMKLANKISEMEMAERNKQFALYTVAILQKLLASEVEKAQGTKLELKDMPMINDIVKIAKNDANPMLRASALASLSYIATPEYKPLLTTMFEQSKKDADPNVQAVAAEALNKLSQI